MWSVEINEEYQLSSSPKCIVCHWLLLIETIQSTSSKSTWVEPKTTVGDPKPMLRCCNKKVTQNNTVKKYEIWKEGKDSIVFPSDLMFLTVLFWIIFLLQQRNIGFGSPTVVFGSIHVDFDEVDCIVSIRSSQRQTMNSGVEENWYSSFISTHHI